MTVFLTLKEILGIGIILLFLLGLAWVMFLEYLAGESGFAWVARRRFREVFSDNSEGMVEDELIRAKEGLERAYMARHEASKRGPAALREAEGEISRALRAFTERRALALLRGHIATVSRVVHRTVTVG